MWGLASTLWPQGLGMASWECLRFLVNHHWHKHIGRIFCFWETTSQSQAWQKSASGFQQAASVTLFPSALPTPPTAVAPNIFGKWGNSCGLTWHSERWMLASWHHSNSGNSWERDGKGTGDYSEEHWAVLDPASEKKVLFIYSTFVSPLITLQTSLEIHELA